MRRKIHDDQIKFIWRRLPLNKDKVLPCGISRPGFPRTKNFSFTAIDGRFPNRAQQFFVKLHNVLDDWFDWLTAKLNGRTNQ